MKRIILSMTVFLFACLLPAQNILTIAESSNYTKTSLYDDVMSFLYQVQKKSDLIKILPLTTSSEGRLIPLVVLSREKISRPADLQMVGKAAVLIMANIHAGEIEGKEASLMLIRDIAMGRLAKLLENQVLLFIPIFNTDGNDKLGHNRHDLGPELAGVRFNGQNLDLNRDYLKLESPEVCALVALFNTWDPVLVVDMHTTNGSYHREPVTYSTLLNPNSPEKLRNFMWQKFFPSVALMLKSVYGYDSLPYGNFVDREFPAKGWESDAFEARYGSNYVGLRNRFSILNENYSYSDYKTRVFASQAFITCILDFTAKNIGLMTTMVRQLDKETARSFSRGEFVLEFKLAKLFDLTVKSYEFIKETIKPEDRAKYPSWVGDFIMKKTDVCKDYRMPYFSLTVPDRSLPLPAGYVVPEVQSEILANLKRHGIRVERIMEGFKGEVDIFKIEKVDIAKTIFQGHVLNTIKGRYEKGLTDIPSGWYFVSLEQPLARLIPVLLEPESSDSLAAWGFFNRIIVQQWSSEPGPYPVWRLLQPPPVALLGESN